MAGDEKLADLDDAQSAFEDLIARVMPTVADLPTPCAEWNGRQLLNHLVGGQKAFAAILTAAGPIDREADFLGDDPVAADRAANAELIAALEQPDVLTKTFRSPIGEVPGAAIAQLRTVEHLVHGWDLAVAAGETFVIDPALTERAIAAAKAMLHGVPRTGHPFGPEHVAPVDASPLDRLAALLGRPAPWSPGSVG